MAKLRKQLATHFGLAQDCRSTTSAWAVCKFSLSFLSGCTVNFAIHVNFAHFFWRNSCRAAAVSQSSDGSQLPKHGLWCLSFRGTAGQNGSYQHRRVWWKFSAVIDICIQHFSDFCGCLLLLLIFILLLLLLCWPSWLDCRWNVFSWTGVRRNPHCGAARLNQACLVSAMKIIRANASSGWLNLY